MQQAVFILLAGMWSAAAFGAEDQGNWPHWRGPNDNGSMRHGDYPVKWDAANVLWKTTLPGKGCSTPVVWDERIFLTAPVNGQDAALALDWNGKLLWQKAFGDQAPGKRRESSGCNPSPATDGRSVFVYFNSGTLAALDLNGAPRWQTNIVTAFGHEGLYWDRGTSPVLSEKSVIIVRMHHGQSWVASFDKADGRLNWKVPRSYPTPLEDDDCYTSPIVIREGPEEAVVSWGADHVTSHAVADGRLLWSCGGFNAGSVVHMPAVASPVVAAGYLIVLCHDPKSKHPELDGIRLGGRGDVTETRRVWRQKSAAFVPTPAAENGRVYVLGDRGELSCVDPATGNSLWQGELPKTSASYYASPVFAGGKLYAAREDGVVFVVQAQDKFDLLAENRMGEQIIASPVAVSNRLLIRGERHLFCIAE